MKDESKVQHPRTEELPIQDRSPEASVCVPGIDSRKRPDEGVRPPDRDDSSFGIRHSFAVRPSDLGFSPPVHMRINGHPITIPAGTLVAAAIAHAGVTCFRRSVLGQPRGPLCGMGICMECRVTIDGLPHCRSCLVVCREGMDVETA